MIDKIKDFLGLDDAEQKDHLQRDLANVSLSARLLQISEFEYFRKSYYQWYGREIPERNLEYVFAQYMFRDEVPHYVRDFSRRVICLFNRGALDPKKFNIFHAKSTPEQRSAGIRYTILVLLVVLIFCLLITDYIPFQ